MRVLLVGSLGAHLLRIPLGNLLSALGRANWNTWTNIAVLVVTALGCMWRIPELGLMGAAQVMAAMMWGSGLLSLALLKRHINRP
jgi:O-antigen/teichoic acid export membrane protein